MKAYQLKIMIKNSKPPIWRRCIVPAGITFSQLSMILNEVMGWSGYHLFEFDFYHQELVISEEEDDFDDFLYLDKRDWAEASRTYINEYLEMEKWFTYTYDFGDDWQHRVTIEKILPDYQHPYPQVVKYKGDCPPEDCGGIGGYYYHLEVLENPAHPEYKEIKDWLESHYSVRTYDMEAVNEEFKNNYTVKYGKGETRTQRQLYDSLFQGKFVLKASKTAKNKDQPVRFHGNQTMDSMQQLVDSFFDRMEAELDGLGFNQIMDVSLASVLSSYTKEDVIEIAETCNLVFKKNCGKSELVYKVVAYMLDEKVMKTRFSYFSDDAIQAFEGLIKGEMPDEAQILYLDEIHEADYVAYREDGTCIVPGDVREAYFKINTPAFQEMRKRKSFLSACLEAASILYGVFPCSVVSAMYEQAGDDKTEIGKWTEAQIKKVVKEMPEHLNHYELKDNLIIDSPLFVTGDYIYLQKIQEGKGFYLPTRQEINDLALYACFPNDEYLLKLKQCLKSIGDEEMTEMFAPAIQGAIMAGREIEELFQMLAKITEEIDKKQMKKITSIVMDMWNNTRMIIHRGYTPQEIGSIARKPEKKETKIIDLSSRKKEKVYPNSPCPCKSGKKYKHCCGKNK